MSKSRQALDGKIINIRRGLAIYKTHASPYYYARVWIPSKKKRVVKTTKATNRAEAITVAEELFSAMGTRGALAVTPNERTFGFFADKVLDSEKARGERGEVHKRLWQTTKAYLANPVWGLLKRFVTTDVTTIRAHDYYNYLEWVRTQNNALKPQTLIHVAATFGKVMKAAQLDEVIDSVPRIVRTRRKDTPRPFFRFFPLVTKAEDEYDMLLKTAKELGKENATVGGVLLDDEIYDFILFMTHSFLRPTESEVYALTHRDIAMGDNPKRLIITIRKGKTGHRVSNTMPAAATVYQRIKSRQEGFTKNDYLFFPSCLNRSRAKVIVQRQFNAILERAGLKTDHNSGTDRTVYSLRHTAICMRLVLSEGKVNIFNLAKNAGTSVEQIERFYAKNLPQSAEMARNLQSVGAET